jgi:hypothetical protein
VANTLGFDLCGLQLVQAAFGLWKALPTQAVEKVVQAVACWDLGGFENEVFVRLVVGQGRLGDEPHVLGVAKRIRNALKLQRAVGRWLPQFAPRLKPWLRPINLG